MMDITARFCDTLRAWREYRGMTHYDLSFAIGLIGGDKIREYEEEYRSVWAVPLYDIYWLAKMLGCTVEQLVEGVLPRETPKPKAVVPEKESTDGLSCPEAPM